MSWFSGAFIRVLMSAVACLFGCASGFVWPARCRILCVAVFGITDKATRAGHWSIVRDGLKTQQFQARKLKFREIGAALNQDAARP
jgi:hypothetical protein